MCGEALPFRQMQLHSLGRPTRGFGRGVPVLKYHEVRFLLCNTLRAQIFLGVVFTKGWQFLLVSLKKVLGVGFRWAVGGGVSSGKKGKRGRGWGGWGVGWGQAKEPASQCTSSVETTL